MLGRNFYSYRSRQPDLAPTVFRILRTSISRENRRRYNNYLAGRSQFSEQLSKYDFVKFDYGGQFRRDMVEAVERFVKLIPVFLSLFPYYYFKISFVSLFRAQGVQMAFPDWDVESRDPDTNDVNLKLPISWYSTGINLAIVTIFIPIVMFINSATFHSFLVKAKVFLYRARGRKGTIILEVDLPFAFSASKDHRRLILGLCFALLSIIFAIFLDVVRHSLFQDCVHNLSYQSNNTSCTFNQTFNGVTYESYDISILWQLPQEYMAAVSEVFVVVTAYQIAYLQAPDYEEEPYKMQGIFIGLHFLSRAVGAAFVLALSNLLSLSSHLCIFQPDEDDSGTLAHDDDCSLGGESFYKYYIIIAVLQSLGIVSSWYSFRRFFRWSNGQI
ncbi:solute carrier family 15 member 4-like [Convolutriloba macropyga]|uniref:solute carrier family 15 member 4-like n=1 Tax=Convolutriloba macropyga TaxID=536237 RepID=UPI003F51D7E0